MKAKVKNVMITGLILLGFYIVVKIMLNVFLILKAERLNDIFFDHIAGKQYNEDLKKTEALLMDITDNIHGGMLLSIDAYTYSSDYMEEVADSYPKWERDLFETYYDYEFVPINELKKYNFDRLGHIRYNVPEEERDNEDPLASLHYGIRPLSGAYASSEAAYMLMTKDQNIKAEVARSVLPNCTATTIYMKANIREWRHIFNLRVSKHSQTDIRKLMKELLIKMYKEYPVFFEDLYNKVVQQGTLD